MKKIWGDYDVDSHVNEYTIGQDLLIDAKLMKYDLMATSAHVSMLHSVGILDDEEHSIIQKAIKVLKLRCSKQGFAIPKKYEDGHSYIEAELTKMCGDSGKKVHFLRSRNDQALVMIRLFAIDILKEIDTQAQILQKSLGTVSSRHKGTHMPGYTHMQKAMPTTVDTWLESFADALVDIRLSSNVAAVLDQNPLGSGAGYGFVGQKIKPDQKHTAKALGLKHVQKNPMYCSMSRGLYEFMVLSQLYPYMVLASHWAGDNLLFTMEEFDFVSLPDEFTTGSSIMPQKRNYDLYEIMRGNQSIFWGYSTQINGIIAKRTSGYQRDLQLTKKPFVEACEIVLATIKMWNKTVKNLKINKPNMKNAMSPNLYATGKVNDLVSQGITFRDAYIQIKQAIKEEL